MANTARRINSTPINEHKMAALGYGQGYHDGCNTDKGIHVEYETMRELANDSFWDLDVNDPMGYLMAEFQGAYIRGFRKGHGS